MSDCRDTLVKLRNSVSAIDLDDHAESFDERLALKSFRREVVNLVQGLIDEQNEKPSGPEPDFSLLLKVLSGQKNGEKVIELVRRMVPGVYYSSFDLGKFLGLTAIEFGMVVTLLARTESRAGCSVFIKEGNGKTRLYSVSDEVCSAFKDFEG